MPNRILRDWTDSDRMDALSAEAERFFTRLIMKADDYGRYSADPKRLRAFLFPLKDSVADTDCARWLAECEQAGLVGFYEAAGKRYLEIVNFRQRLRVMKEIHPRPSNAPAPPPPASPPPDDGHMTVIRPLRNETKGIESESEPETQLETNANTSTHPDANKAVPVSISVSVTGPVNANNHQEGKSRYDPKSVLDELSASRFKTGTIDLEAEPGLVPVRGEPLSLLTEKLNAAYQRSGGSPWTYAEQAQLAEIARRPEALTELELMLAHRRRLPGNEKRFFPNSIGSLLTKWTDVLDQARLHRPEPIRFTPPPPLKGEKLSEAQRARLAAQLAETKRCL